MAALLIPEAVLPLPTAELNLLEALLALPIAELSESDAVLLLPTAVLAALEAVLALPRAVLLEPEAALPTPRPSVFKPDAVPKPSGPCRLPPPDPSPKRVSAEAKGQEPDKVNKIDNPTFATVLVLKNIRYYFR